MLLMMVAPLDSRRLRIEVSVVSCSLVAYCQKESHGKPNVAFAREAEVVRNGV